MGVPETEPKGFGPEQASDVSIASRMAKAPQGETSDDRQGLQATLTKHAGVLYPSLYAWYILVSSLDIMVTDTVLRHFGAAEVNTIADKAIEKFGLWGLVGLKFLTVIVVVLICEYVGRRRPKSARRLAEWAIALSAVPVIIALTQLALVNTGWLPLEELTNHRPRSID